MKQNQLYKIIYASFLIAATLACQPKMKMQTDEQPFSNARTEAVVNALYDRMSQQERVAQLCGMYLANLFDDNGKLDETKCATLIPNGIGHFSQYASNEVKNPDEIRDMVAQTQKWLRDNTPNGIQALFHEEVITGPTTLGGTVYPQQIGLACSFNTELAELKTRQTAADMRKIGGYLSLSPMVDVSRNPGFNRNEESYGEDSYLSAAMGVAFTKGLQHGGFEKGMAVCSKHFLGYGSGYLSPEKELMEEILMPHEAMIRIGGSKVVMTGYHQFHGINCVANSELMEEILRSHIGFDGLFVSDYGSIEQVTHLAGLDQAHHAATSMNAGNDVDFPEGTNFKYLQQAIDQGLVSQERFEKSVKRVLTLKARMGLLDNSVMPYDTAHIVFDTPEERQTAYTLATQSVVMLKNNGVLPLKPGKILLTGPNANQAWAMTGDYTFPAMSYFWHKQQPVFTNPQIVTLLNGMDKNKPRGYEVSYERGVDWTEIAETNISTGGDQRAAWLIELLDRRIESGETANWEKAITMSANADVIVAAMGENALLCGENRDRGSLRMPGRQEQFVRDLIATGKPVVLILFGGRTQVIGDLADKCAAVIQAWYPGEEGGNALADILYGKVSPSGKLSVSYPAKEIYENTCYNYSVEDNPDIQYPFGYGLSYCDFQYDNCKISSSCGTGQLDAVKVSLTVKNTGDMEATEIVQLYISPTSSDQQLKPIQLQGFKRVTLRAGETKTVNFKLGAQQFGYYSDGQWNIAPGEYTVQVASSSKDIRHSGTVTLKGDVTVIPLRTVFFAE